MKFKFTKNTKNVLKYLGIIILTLVPIIIIMRSLNWQSKFLNKMILREGYLDFNRTNTDTDTDTDDDDNNLCKTKKKRKKVKDIKNLLGMDDSSGILSPLFDKCTDSNGNIKENLSDDDECIGAYNELCEQFYENSRIEKIILDDSMMSFN